MAKKKAKKAKAKSQGNATATKEKTKAADPSAVVFGTGKKGKNIGIAAEVPLDNLHEIKKFNPRSDLGDISQLTASIKKKGILQPPVVRPKKDKKGNSVDGEYEVLCGYRRKASAIAAGLKTVPVVVRLDMDNDLDALGLAMSENSTDARYALPPLDEAAAFNRMLTGDGDKKNEMSFAEVASACGCSAMKVRKSVPLLDAPREVKRRLAEGTLSKQAAIAVTKLDKKVQKAVLPDLGDRATEREVKELANDFAEAQGVKAGKGKSKRPTPGSSGDKIALRRGMKDVRRMLLLMTSDVVDYEEEGKEEMALRLKHGVAFGLWSIGECEHPDDLDDNSFLEAFGGLVEQVAEMSSEEEEEGEEEEE